MKKKVSRQTVLKIYSSTNEFRKFPRTILFLRNNPKKTVFQNINKRQSIRQFYAIFFKNCGFPKNSELPSFLPSFLPFKKKNIYIYNTPIKEGKIKKKKKKRGNSAKTAIRNPQSFRSNQNWQNSLPPLGKILEFPARCGNSFSIPLVGP